MGSCTRESNGLCSVARVALFADTGLRCGRCVRWAMASRAASWMAGCTDVISRACFVKKKRCQGPGMCECIHHCCSHSAGCSTCGCTHRRAVAALFGHSRWSLCRHLRGRIRQVHVCTICACDRMWPAAWPTVSTRLRATEGLFQAHGGLRTASPPLTDRSSTGGHISLAACALIQLSLEERRLRSGCATHVACREEEQRCSPVQREPR